MNVGIVVFDEMELLDMVGFYEVFIIVVCVYGCSQLVDVLLLFCVFVIGDGMVLVCVCVGLCVMLDGLLCEYLLLDCVIVLGGVVDVELGYVVLMVWIVVQVKFVCIFVFVCIGVLLLVQVGVLDGLEVIMYWEDVEVLCVLCFGLCVCEGVCWVDSGWVVILVGIFVGIDMSLYFVVWLYGCELVLCMVWQMEFDWMEVV